jgi:hypothetical protein
MLTLTQQNPWLKTGTVPVNYADPNTEESMVENGHRTQHVLHSVPWPPAPASEVFAREAWQLEGRAPCQSRGRQLQLREGVAGVSYLSSCGMIYGGNGKR